MMFVRAKHAVDAHDSPGVCRIQLQLGFRTPHSSLLHSYCMMLGTMCGCATYEAPLGAYSTLQWMLATPCSGSSPGTTWQRMICPQRATPAVLSLRVMSCTLGKPASVLCCSAMSKVQLQRCRNRASIHSVASPRPCHT